LFKKEKGTGKLKKRPCKPKKLAGFGTVGMGKRGKEGAGGGTDRWGLRQKGAENSPGKTQERKKSGRIHG